MPAQDFSAELAKLKEHVLYNPDFLKTMEYFHDHLADYDEFLSKKVCHSSKNELLGQLMRQALLQFLQRPRLNVRDVQMIRVRGTPFYHGAFSVDEYLCSFIFFEDINRGLLALVRPGHAGTDFIRLTATVVGTGPVYN